MTHVHHRERRRARVHLFPDKHAGELIYFFIWDLLSPIITPWHVNIQM